MSEEESQWFFFLGGRGFDNNAVINSKNGSFWQHLSWHLDQSYQLQRYMLKDTQGTFLKLTLYYIKLKYLNFHWFILKTMKLKIYCFGKKFQIYWFGWFNYGCVYISSIRLTVHGIYLYLQSANTGTGRYFALFVGTCLFTKLHKNRILNYLFPQS